MARTPEHLARMRAARAPRTFQSTNQHPTPSWAWVAAWRASHIACGGSITPVAADRAIALWGLGATSCAAGDSTAREQALESRLAIESSIADALCAARAAAAQVTS